MGTLPFPRLLQSRPRLNRDRRNGNSISDAGRLRRVVNDAAGIARPFTPVPDRAHFDPDRDRGRPRRSSAFHGDHRCASRRGLAECARPGATGRHDPTCRGRDVHGLVHAATEDGNRGHPNSHERPGLGPPSRGDPDQPVILPCARADQRRRGRLGHHDGSGSPQLPVPRPRDCADRGDLPIQRGDAWRGGDVRQPAAAQHHVRTMLHSR